MRSTIIDRTIEDNIPGLVIINMREWKTFSVDIDVLFTKNIRKTRTNNLTKYTEGMKSNRRQESTINISIGLFSAGV